MIHPKIINIDGADLDLTHIWPKNISITLPAIDEKPEIEIPILVFFSNHCISREVKNNEVSHMTDHFGKPRVFCPIRYKLSFDLMDVMQNISDKKCLYSDREGWIIAQLKNVEGDIFEYHIYFTIKKDKKNETGLVIWINSAHVKDKNNKPRFTNRKKRKRFTLIARELLSK